MSLLVSRSADVGADDANDETLQLDLLDATAASQVRFGVGDDESFFLDGPGGLTSTAANALNVDSTYLLVLKIVSQNDASGNHDQVFLKAFESGEMIPDYDDNVVWTLTGER